MKEIFQSNISIIGMGAMGRSLALNIEENCGGVAVYNRPHINESLVVDKFVREEAQGRNIYPAHTLQELIENTLAPHVIILMVSAGKAVDEITDRLLPLLSDGDIIIDAGNSDYRDTTRRCILLEQKNILYVGVGISGGIEGARHGASIMLGGETSARNKVMEIMQKIAARNDDGSRCCGWFGNNGAGHFIKTIHNGIEYALMQLIAEAYALLKHNNTNDFEIAEIFEIWNKGSLKSFLIECTADILHYRTENDDLLLDFIRDAVSEKGTGRISVETAINLNSPFTLINEALNARFLSQQTEYRNTAADVYPGTTPTGITPEAIRQALYCSFIVAYSQGFELLYHAANKGIIGNFENIARVWQQGCIIRSELLKIFAPQMNELHPHGNLLLNRETAGILRPHISSWRHTVSRALTGGISIPCMASALAYFDGLRCRHSTANLIEAQRDYFGAHGYERIDSLAENRFHSDWQNHSIATIYKQTV